jgi:hypothetical protein
LVFIDFFFLFIKFFLLFLNQFLDFLCINIFLLPKTKVSSINI